ncbi:MAG: pilus assembly protein [Actinomycetia bacterium]|nr:pilus assembly protein [Actinomycetes bacterium]
MKKPIKIKQQKGAAAVEFAIILPVLIMLIFGIYQFGIAYNRYITLTHAAREGARVAAVDYNNEDIPDPESYIKQIVIERATSIYDLTEDDISINLPEGNKIGKPIEIEILYNLFIEIPLVNSWNIELTPKGIMRLER